MFNGTTYRRCKCTEPKLDDQGQPILNVNGTPKVRELGSACPQLDKRDHGSWYYYLNLPDGPGGKRRRPRKGGFPTSKAAKEAAQKLWDEATDGIDVDSKETVAAYLNRWLDKRVDFKRGTREEYRDCIDRILIPALGHLAMRELRERHIQEMFKQVWAFNEVKAANQITAQQAKAECEDAYRAWKQAPAPRPRHFRQRWDAAKAALKEARTKPRRNTGPGTQRKYKNTLAAALSDAVTEKLITENWAKHITLPKYERPEALVWTDERVARWKLTGEKPSPVMVWTPNQTGEFLDAAVDHPMYIMWHLMAFRAPRRGEATGLPWSEVDMTRGVARIVEQLSTNSSYEVWEDTPKSRAGKRAVTLDYATFALLTAWRDVQQAQRAEWEQKHRDDPSKYGPYNDSGKVFTQADGRPHHPSNVSQAFERFIKRLGLPPIRLHDLRHCAASLSLAAGLSMKAIQALLGHSSYQLTADTYTSLMPQFEQAAANAPVDLVPRRKAIEQATREDPPAGATTGDQTSDDEPHLYLVLPSVPPGEASDAA
ncbi:tyrosine-type recombinase/integrase [Streptomyces coacervatus]|uniref:Tyrosine-type recombinase/integrase n=1 Tax=Streptomyces coacervatus TaxID=647381 RepID=A0ABP7JRB7_9ACTN|nr:tyrosine-type recombinase/integrase [Streptomyces coacervatus]MDF2263873.1 tyrosine-type recombinase/integrase [Streptomyces coacervatus]